MVVISRSHKSQNEYRAHNKIQPSFNIWHVAFTAFENSVLRERELDGLEAR